MRGKSILLCEGETDQVILSYYFKHKFHYEYTDKIGNWLDKKSLEESVCLYERPEDHDELTIWAVGSQSLLEEAFNIVLLMNKTNTDCTYSRIVIIADHDSDKENEKLWNKINNVMGCFGMEEKLEKTRWTKTMQKISFDEEMELEILGLSIPLDKEGALETFLLNALSEQKNNQYLAQRSSEFVTSLKNDGDKLNGYLSSRRLCVKAPLAVFFAVANPERTFQSFNKVLLSVPWEQYQTVQESFNLLKKFELTTQ